MQFINTEKLLKGFEVTEEIPSQKEILSNTIKMAWPAVVESFLVSLTSFVDTIMIGALGSYAIAAVGLTTQPKFLALAVFIALSVAVSSVTSRRKGENDRESANKILRTAIIFCVTLTSLVSVLFIAFADPILKLIGSEAQTHEAAKEYYVVIMIGLIFTTMSIVINACQRGAGNTIIAMRTNVIANLINMLFNFLLIEGRFGFPALGITGAALATVIGTTVGCAISFYSITKPTGFIYIKAVKGIWAKVSDIKSIINVGSSALVEQVFLRLGFLLVTMVIARLGTTALAANQIAMNFASISFCVADGLAIASVALVGRSLGQKRLDLARIYSSSCQKIGLICSTFIAPLFFFFGRYMFLLFTNEQVILDYGQQIMQILSIAVFFQVSQVNMMGCLRGAGDTKFTAMVSLLSVTFIRPFSSWLFCYPLGLGLIGAWFGFTTDQFVRFLLSFIRFKKGKWLKIKL